MVRFTRWAAVLILLVALATPLFIVVHAQQETLVKKMVFVRIESDSDAVQSLLNGKTQGRLFGLRDPNLARKLAEKGFQVIAPISGLVDILANPAPCKNGEFNPFTIPEVRYALNFLINRKYIVDKIYQGYAVPAIIPYSPADPDYVNLLPVAAKYEALFSRGFEYGKKLIYEAMRKAGAELKNGVWYYHGKPVVIKFVIRIEDKRKDIGDYLASILEKLGFKVEKLYKNFAAAANIVYSSDPSECKWMLYTEGWGFTGMTKYDSDTAVAFYTDVYGLQPGWGVKSYWNYKPPKPLEEAAMKLVKNEYKSPQEFWKLYREVVDLGVKQGVRVMVVFTKDFYIAAPGVKGLVEPPKSSPWNYYSFLGLKYTEPEVKLSNRYVYAQGWAWNPVGGFQDFYSRPVVEAVTTYGITTNPLTGEPGWSLPGVANWKLVGRNVVVPEGAITWDAKHHKWVSAAGLHAKSAVLVNYPILAKLRFHDGSKVGWVDALASVYIIKEWATQAGKNDTRYEAPLAQLYANFLTYFVAVKPVNKTAAIVYLNYTHFDPGMIATQADMLPNWPLELYIGMEQLVLHKDAGWTQAGSKAIGKPWLNLISKDQCNKMVKYLEAMVEGKQPLPDWVEGLIKMGLISKQEVIKRLQNLINFIKAHGEAVVSTGPFMLVKYDAVNDAAYLERVEDYPVNPNLPSKVLRKHTAELAAVVRPIVVDKPGAPVASLHVYVDGEPATLKNVKLYAFLVSGTGNVTELGVRFTKQPGRAMAYLKSEVEPGTYSLVAYAYPVGYNMPATYQAQLRVVPVTTTTTTPTTTQKPTTTAPPAPRTVTVTRTIVSTVTVTRTARGPSANAAALAVAAIVMFIIGLAIGFVAARRR